MTPLELCLTTVSNLSGEIAAAEAADDADALAGIIAGCQLCETRAQNTLAGRVNQSQINDVKAEARIALGSGW